MPDNEKLRLAKNIRNTIHNLVITEESELDNLFYFDKLKTFIGAVEGCRKDTYMDGINDPQDNSKWMSAADFYALDKEKQKELREACKPVPTVGIGSNIKTEASRQRLDKALGEPGLMQQVYYGEKDLTDKQVEAVFRHDIEIRSAELRKDYGANWDKFRPNEKITISSLYFNHPSLAKRDTNFHKNMMKYVETNDPKYLQNAVDEVEKRSNGGNSVGIQNRRDAEGALLNSPEVPDDSSELPKKASLNKTIVPLKNATFDQGINQDYFIWRTRMDNKVRSSHISLEGKIFRKDDPPGGHMPGTYANCRCHAEEVPDCIKITEGEASDKEEDEAEKKAFEMYLRKGTWHPSLNNYRSNTQKDLSYSDRMTEKKAFEMYLRKGVRHPSLWS